MWSIYILRPTCVEQTEEWIAVAGGYVTPERAAKDIDEVRTAWDAAADGIMIGMEVWRRDE